MNTYIYIYTYAYIYIYIYLYAQVYRSPGYRSGGEPCRTKRSRRRWRRCPRSPPPRCEGVDEACRGARILVHFAQGCLDFLLLTNGFSVLNH